MVTPYPLCHIPLGGWQLNPKEQSARDVEEPILERVVIPPPDAPQRVARGVMFSGGSMEVSVRD